MPIQFEACGAEESLGPSDLVYYKEQNKIFSSILESYFDNEKPAYQSLERRNALYLIDTMTHYPSPYDDCVKGFFFNRYKKAIDNIKVTKIETGATIWNLYNMGYVVRTKDITVAFDLISLPVSLRKDDNPATYQELAKEVIGLCDILFVSHMHGDHADPFVAKEFLLQNKPIVAPNDAFGDQAYYDKITHLERDGFVHALNVGNKKLTVRIYPGHQAISEINTIDNNYVFLTFPSGITVSHSGDQSWNDDFTWIDNVHKNVDVDILLSNCWTANPNAVVDGIRPKVVLPGHINEMDHPIPGRIAYWKSYESWKDVDTDVIHLLWGERYKYDNQTREKVTDL